MATPTFIQKLFVEYPIPRSLSCWGSAPGVPPVEDINVLVATVVEELASDILTVHHLEASGMITTMPEGTLNCSSAKLSSIYPFQGNRLVKVTYDPSSRKAFLRYYPAVITYKKKLVLSDLDNLDGDRLIYVKAYCLWKMAQKELGILKPANMNVDNGQLDFSVLEAFRDAQFKLYSDLKPEILMYSTVN